MKTLEELINHEEPGWDLVRQWIAEASRPCEVLPQSEAHRGDALVATQVTTRSPMGAIIYECAGLLIDDGWLRILGSGKHSRLQRSLPEWNKNRSNGFCLVADDAIGGWFAINGGGLGADAGNIYYFAPDTLKWEPCGFAYSQFIVWSLGSKLDAFYENFRWAGWQDEVRELSGDRTFFFYPFLWAVGPSLAERHRGTVPVEETYGLSVGGVAQPH